MSLNLNLIAFNLRGLSETHTPNFSMEIGKLNSIISSLHPSILILTETHNNSYTLNQISTISSISDHGGVQILTYNSDIKISHFVICPNGNFVFASINYGINSFNLLAIYAPGNHNNRKEWLLSEFPYNLSPDIIMGDFNIGFDPNALGPPKPVRVFERDFLTYLKSLYFSDCADLSQNFNFTFFAGSRNSRIDRAYLSPLVSPNFKKYNTINLPRRFDHRGIQVILGDLALNTSPWRYSSNILGCPLRKPQTLSIIKRNISSLTSWLESKAQIINYIKPLQISIKKCLSTKHNNALKLIKASPPCSIQATLSIELDSLLNQEVNRKLRKQGIYLEKNNERPSKRLTNLLKPNNRSLIQYLTNPRTKEKVNSISQMHTIATDFYTKLYSKHPTCSICIDKFFFPMSVKISPLDKKLIVSKITFEEVRDAILFSKISSPGEDGLSNEFYKDFSDNLIAPLTILFNKFLNGLSLPSEMKYGTTITLYKNKGDPGDLGNRRPITLLNNDYKLYSSILNKRILKTLPSILSYRQQGFVPKRSILENPLLLDLIIRSSKTHTIAFIDFWKAFDSVSHIAISKALYCFGFPQQFIRAIKKLIKGSNIKININNYLTDPIPILKGTKQGDPISPSLFDIVIEILSVTLDNSLIGVTINDTKYTHLLFADDLVLICADHDELLKAHSILEDFFCASGLRVNLDKCLAFSTDHIPYNSPFQVMTEPTVYLGFRFNNKGLVNALDRLEKLPALLEKWRVTTSQRNRAIILKTYGHSQFWHQQYLSINPPSTTAKIDNITNWFVWYNEPTFDTRRKYVAKMTFLRSSKEYWEGGLKLWDSDTRYRSQKAWLLEHVLRSTQNTSYDLTMNILH